MKNKHLLEKAKPILFNTEMVKAILDGRKSQTRRVLGDRFRITEFIPFDEKEKQEGYKFSILDKKENSKYDTASLNFFVAMGFSKYKVGDIIYVREKSYFVDCDCQSPWQCSPQGWYATDEVCYSDIRCSVKTVPSIHMPKKYARIFLKVTNVRVERLQDISDDDCIKEGILSFRELCESVPDFDETLTDNDLWQVLWNSTAKDGYKWEDNPYVFVYKFERVEL